MKNVLSFLTSIVLCTLAVHAQPTTLRFDHIAVEDGLSESTVTKILQDSQGYLWFGTQDGLNMYDGHEITVFRTDPADSTSLCDSYVTSLYEDRRGSLWVGTHSGSIDTFDRTRRSFSHIAPNGRALVQGSYPISTMIEDSAGCLWVGTIGGGALRWDPALQRWTSFRHSPDTGTLSNNYVWAMFTDKAGALWIGTYDGLNRFDAPRNTFGCLRLPEVEGVSSRNVFNAIAEDAFGRLWVASWRQGLVVVDQDRRSIRLWSPPASADGPTLDDRIWTLAFDRSGNLWIGTRSGGLLRYDGITLHQYLHEPDNRVSVSANEVMSLFVDRSDILWVGTNGAGVDKYATAHRGFKHYRHSGSTANTISGNNVWALSQDRAGDLWIGTLGTGVDRIDTRTERVIRGTNVPLPGGVPSEMVVAILEDRQGLLWLGTQGDGLFCVDRHRNRTVHFLNAPADSTSLGANTVNALLEDADGDLWIATMAGGLNKLDRKTGRFTRFTRDIRDPQSLSDDDIITLCTSSRGGLWVGTLAGGVVKFDNGRCTAYGHDPHNPNSLSNNRVLSLHEDSAGILWIGTWGGGLNRLNPATGEFRRYSQYDGLPNTTIDALLEDDRGNLWMSTNKGIARFDPQKNIFKVFDHTDGLQSDEFNQGASLKMQSGELLFGGINGFTRFHPDSIWENTVPPPVVLTSFSVVGQPFQLHGALSSISEIRLRYTENTFTCEFAALDFLSPSRNRYAYLLDGFDHSWVRPVTGQFATYSNVPPGTYVFRVGASNGDGVWNWDGAAMRVIISPPPWRTWWAYTLYALVVAGSIALYMRRKSLRQAQIVEGQKRRLQEGEMQLAKERMVSESLRRAEEKVSASLHEKEALLKEIHHRVKNNMQVISSLLNLQADQIGDQNVRNLFRESQDRVRSMALIHEKLYRSERLSKIDFQAYAHDLATQLARAYAHRPVDMNLEVEPISLSIETAIPCGLIINELVTNALKHAFPEEVRALREPSITLAMKFSPIDGYNLSVADNGVGLPKTVDFFHPPSLGLELVNSLTEQLSGSLSVDSTLGTCVRITFPVE